MAETHRRQLPIGYWIKQVDNLLTEAIDSAHTRHQISRTEWQVLNTLSEAPAVTRGQLLQVMQAFVDAAGLDQTVTGLSQRGFIEQLADEVAGAGGLRLTEDGRRQHTILFEDQKNIRQRAMQGISQDEYLATVSVLQRIVANLQV